MPNDVLSVYLKAFASDIRVPLFLFSFHNSARVYAAGF